MPHFLGAESEFDNESNQAQPINNHTSSFNLMQLNNIGDQMVQFNSKGEQMDNMEEQSEVANVGEVFFNEDSYQQSTTPMDAFSQPPFASNHKNFD